MINFKNRDLAAPSAVIVASIVILLCALLFMLFVPPPSTSVPGASLTTRQLADGIANARTHAAQAEAATRPRLWEGTPETIMAQVLSQLTIASQLQKLQMAAFRPQKQQPVSGLLELPFSVQLSGPYLTVLNFLRSLDTPQTKVALRSVQFASSGGDSSTVTATANLSLYCVDNTAAEMNSAPLGARPMARPGGRMPLRPSLVPGEPTAPERYTVPGRPAVHILTPSNPSGTAPAARIVPAAGGSRG